MRLKYKYQVLREFSNPNKKYDYVLTSDLEAVIKWVTSNLQDPDCKKITIQAAKKPTF